MSDRDSRFSDAAHLTFIAASGVAALVLVSGFALLYGPSRTAETCHCTCTVEESK